MHASLYYLQPRWGDLDINQHVNNVKYIGWILEVLNSSFCWFQLVFTVMFVNGHMSLMATWGYVLMNLTAALTFSKFFTSNKLTCPCPTITNFHIMHITLNILIIYCRWKFYPCLRAALLPKFQRRRWDMWHVFLLFSVLISAAYHTYLIKVVILSEQVISWDDPSLRGYELTLQHTEIPSVWGQIQKRHTIGSCS